MSVCLCVCVSVCCGCVCVVGVCVCVCASECDRETSIIRRLWPTMRLLRHGNI